MTARLDEAKDSLLQVLDNPTVPDTKSGPYRTIISVLGLCIGLNFGIARVLLNSTRTPMVKPSI